MKRKILFIYLLLLGISHLVLRLRPAETRLLPGQKSLLLAAVNIGYFDSGSSEKPVLLLIHGSPIGAAVFPPVIRELQKYFRVIAPSLPGFEASTRKIPDYSVRAHAQYLAEFLSLLKINSAHVAGYSMGSGVAIELAHLLPEKIESLILLSGIGVQEQELLGNYYLNHLLHGTQLAFFWGMHNLTPHFGFWNWFPLNYYYARNFYDTDQRPLRKYLSEFRASMLIVHGSDDAFVPLAAAYEHHRLVRRSAIRIFPGKGHLLIFDEPRAIAYAMNEFVAGELANTGYESYGAGATKSFPWLLVILIIIATFVSEDLTCIAAGILAANGNISLPLAVIASFAGLVLGDMMLMLSGRWLRNTRIAERAAIRSATGWLERRGAWAIFASRFVPGTRLPLYLAVGMSRMNMGQSILAFCAACLVWTPAIVLLAYMTGERALALLEKYNHAAPLIVLCVVLFWLSIQKILLPLISWRGRRLLYSSWLRWTHWEFWPPYVFYIPLGFFIAYLMVRYRSFTLFTAANPGIPDGGVIGESKAAILENLAGAGRAIARFALVSDISGLQNFMRQNKLRYPVVLKPDVGERGNGVVIARSKTDAEKYLDANLKAVIAQEYIPGMEYGVFYFRYPNAKKGEILAITDKRFPVLTGDGVSTLEELILSDARAVAMARFHLERFATRLGEVLRRGKKFSLVELGTHAKGSLFLDGGHLKTQRLVDAIDRISHQFRGFYFGRYDIRVPSLAEFKAGKNLKVVELNGVTSEATSIYDPANSLWHAYTLLARQWRIAFEIGRQNRSRGAKPTPLWRLLKNILSVI